MKSLKVIVFVLPALLIFATGTLAQELPADDTGIKAEAGAARDADGKDEPADPRADSFAAISSTAPGGLWSSPSTWVGGVVPGAGDDVTISPGSAVVIDTNATAANLTVGPDISFNVGVLTFDPTAARSLTVTGNLTVSGLGLLTTPSSGTVATHTITVGGNLTNNGILDLSTNSNQAGAGLVFTGASNNTFGGGGSQTNIRTITVNKGTSNVNTLTLSVLNFTVQGSATDTAASGYLTLTNGTFKLSGTFSGNHRTFPTATYTIPATTIFWLDNPNYTVTAQNGDVTVEGRLRMSAGTYNAGTTADNFLKAGDMEGFFTIDGGNLNVAGNMRKGSQFPGASYTQNGGTVTTCMAGNSAPCFNLGGMGTGGTLVIQTPAAVPSDTLRDFTGFYGIDSSQPSPTVQFGNASTPGTGIFTCAPLILPNVVIDTTSGQHTVKVTGSGNNEIMIRNLNIGAGATLDIGDRPFIMFGGTFVNNGTLKVLPTSNVSFSAPVGGPSGLNINYSGTGSFSGPVNSFFVNAITSLTLDPAAGSIRTRTLVVYGVQVINAGRITVGLNDAIVSTVKLNGDASLDSAPVFDLGTGGQKLIYDNSISRTTGPEINPARELVELTNQFADNTITIAGGDVTLNGTLNLKLGVIDTGGNRLIHMSGDAIRSGSGEYVRGTLVRRFTNSNPVYTFFVGDNHFASVQIVASSVPAGPADVAVTPRDMTLAGLPPATSASFSWDIQQTGTMTSALTLNYDNSDINGSESIYRAWRSTAGAPTVVSSTVSTPSNLVTAQGITSLTASWGISERPPPISIGGTVMTAGGQGIRNAILTLTGGTLTVPRVVQTGSFGTYSFSSLEAGGEYTVKVSAKRHRFTPSSQVITSTTSVTDVNFIANPE